MSDPVIIIDSREQRPWSFSPDVRTEVDGLKTGDYSLKGFEEQVAIERKSLDDLVGSLTQGRRRFMAEMERLAQFRFKCVVVEAPVQGIFDWHYRSRAHPNSLLGSIVVLELDFGIPVHWMGNRQDAARYTEKFLVKAHKRLVQMAAAEGEGSSELDEPSSHMTPPCS